MGVYQSQTGGHTGRVQCRWAFSRATLTREVVNDKHRYGHADIVEKIFTLGAKQDLNVDAVDKVRSAQNLDVTHCLTLQPRPLHGASLGKRAWAEAAMMAGRGEADGGTTRCMCHTRAGGVDGAAHRFGEGPPEGGQGAA
jgi:hypothetical protein